MIKSTDRIAALLILTALAAAPAQAAERDGYYFGFGLGLPSADSDCDSEYDCDGDDTSFRFYGGKRLHENLALELSFQDLGRLRDEDGPVTRTAESTGVNLSLMGIIPVSEVGFLYGKFGYMAWETDYRSSDAPDAGTSDDGIDFTFGAGFAFTFGEKYDFRIEYERLNELDDNFTPGGAPISGLNFSASVYLD